MARIEIMVENIYFHTRGKDYARPSTGEMEGLYVALCSCMFEEKNLGRKTVTQLIKGPESVKIKNIRRNQKQTFKINLAHIYLAIIE